jgi:acyl-CoA reductase-like NAD-dependent aldehyde dehydrogenase
MQDPIQVARHAQRTWAALTVRERAARMRPLRHALAARMDEAVAILCAETGKPPMDALTGDVLVTLEHLRYCERHAAAVLAARRIGRPAVLYFGARFEERMEPHGVALVLAPWNYPLQLAMVPLTTALFAGNAVVLKCSEHAPATAQLIADLCREAALPEGLVQVASGGPEQAQRLLEARPDIVFFTGSSSNGRALAQQAAALLVPVVLELGGKDACLIFASAHLHRAIEGATYAAFSNAGQVCVGAKRLYVERSVFDVFLQGFVERARQLRIGTTLAADMGPILQRPLRERLAAQVGDALARGAVLHTAWDRDSERVAPIILSGVPQDALLLQQESFGPIVCVAPFDDEAHAIELANDSPFQLGASVFTGSAAQADRIASALRAGSCSVNDAIRSIGNPHAGFGGNADSGYGRYHGPHGLLAFSRIKTVMRVGQMRSREIHWFPFTAATFRMLRGLMLWRHASGAPWRRVRTMLNRNNDSSLDGGEA